MRDVKEAVKNAVETLKSLGAEVDEVSLQMHEIWYSIILCYRVIKHQRT